MLEWYYNRDNNEVVECSVFHQNIPEAVLTAPGECFDASEHFRLGIGGQAKRFQDALDCLKGVRDSRTDLQPTALVSRRQCAAPFITRGEEK